MAVQLFPEFTDLPTLLTRSQSEKRAAANSNKILLVVSVVAVSFKGGTLRAEEGGGVSAGSCSLWFLGGAGGRNKVMHHPGEP